MSKDPAALEPILADSLHLMSVRLSHGDRGAGGSYPYEESLQMHRKLMRNSPAAFAPKFAYLLRNYAVHLRNGEQWVDSHSYGRVRGYLSGSHLETPTTVWREEVSSSCPRRLS